MAKQKRKNKPYSLVSAVAVLIAIIFFFAISPNSNNNIKTAVDDDDYPLKVTFLNVGQGDCSLIECGDTVILIDGGESEYAGTVNSYLTYEGISEIDCYIVSHPHSDHMGALPSILKVNEVKEVMMTSFSEINIPTTNVYEKMLDAVSDEECDVLYVWAGETYTYGELTLDILSPSVQTDDYNDMSIIVRVLYGDTSFLFTGDATRTAEKIVIEQYDVDADVLKVGHHGSSTSSSEDFITAVSPSFAVISCGANNSYGHPHKEVVNLFDSLNIPTRRTDEEGNIVVYSDGKNIYVDGIEE